MRGKASVRSSEDNSDSSLTDPNRYRRGDLRTGTGGDGGFLVGDGAKPEGGYSLPILLSGVTVRMVDFLVWRLSLEVNELSFDCDGSVSRGYTIGATSS